MSVIFGFRDRAREMSVAIDAHIALKIATIIRETTKFSALGGIVT